MIREVTWLISSNLKLDDSDSIVAGTGNTTIWGGGYDTVQGASSGGSALIGFAGGNETFWDDGAQALADPMHDGMLNHRIHLLLHAHDRLRGQRRRIAED